jgi:lysophospholipase L1-like esterase
MVNKGVGGETATQIRARMVADKVRGKTTPVIIWVGRNNVGTGSFIADVLAEIATMVANLAPGTPYVIGSFTPTTAENSSSANGIAIASLNTQIKSIYGAHVADIFTAVATDPGSVPPASIMSDPTHFNDAGYDIVTATFQTALAANGVV